MNDLLLAYRACGADCRDGYLRGVVNETGLALDCALIAAYGAWKLKRWRVLAAASAAVND